MMRVLSRRRARAPRGLAIHSAFFAGLLLLALTPTAFGAETGWSGDWHSFWRTGQALMRLEQQGDRVTGTYTPGDGRIEGTVEGAVFSGTWTQAEADGTFEFALSPDGRSFAGRFGNGEYWNGERVRGGTFTVSPFTRSDTPREAFRSIVAAANAAAEGDTAAALVYDPLIAYEGPDTGQTDRRARRRAFYRPMDMSTFRFADIPDRDVDGDGVVRFAIGPAGADARLDIEMRRGDDGVWRLVLPNVETLQRATRSFLEATGAADFGDYRWRRRNSPRGAMRAFLNGVKTWDEGGQAKAVAAMDLSAVPPALFAVNAPLAADYLRQIIDRLGYVIWQEIPDNPDASAPYVHFDHAAGDIVIDALRDDSGGVDWRFTRETIEAAPAIFEAIQSLPLAPGLTEPEPFSEYFRIREWVRGISPALLTRDLLLARWQWIALLLALVGAGAAAFLAGRALRAAWSWLAGPTTGDEAERAETDAARDGVASAVRLLVIGAVCYAAFGSLGLRTDVVSVLATGAALVMLTGGVTLAYRIAGMIGGVFHARAAQTPGYVDEIVSSLATGIVKVAILVGGVILAADIVGLPYEGVVAGLGVGGLALAIAARDTVSNFFGAAVLLADRPFKRGDFVELDGQSAVVEDVGLRSSRLRLLNDAQMVIPNAKVADASVINYGRRRKRQIILRLSITYDTPRETMDAFVERLRDLLRDFPRMDPEYYVGLNGFAASSIEIDLRCYLWVGTYGDQVEYQHRLIGDIVALAEAMGVSFAFPTRTLHVRAEGGASPLLSDGARAMPGASVKS